MRRGEKRWWSLPVRRQRSIVGDTLALQLIFASLMGILAIGGLWAISQAVINDNTQKWTQTWITELEELGAPLFKSNDNERFLRIENYIANFPEIALVRYYNTDGSILFSDTSKTTSSEDNLAPLSRAQMDRLGTTIGTDKPYLLDTSMKRQSLILVLAPVWIESMNPGDLLNLDLKSGTADEIEVIGFIEMGLDFNRYQDQLVSSIVTGSVVFAVALLLLAISARYLLKGALRPLTDLEIPLSRLAAGETEIDVGSTGPTEIMAINNALKTTINALNQRDKMLRRLADYDSLTGLPNRRYFTQELEDEIAWVIETGKTSALLFVDLDQFKYVNDSLGHAVGDKMLVQAASSLKSNLRKNDLIARFGGDEFTIILKDINKGSTIQIVEELMKVMQDIQFIADGQSLSILCSIGVTTIDSGQCPADELLAQADRACHEAKKCGRNRYQVHEVSSQEKSRRTADMGWSQRIQNSLKDNKLLLHYQPIIDLDTGHPAMYEVLVRMRGEDNKIISPMAFIPAANRFGLMVDIDHFVIRTAMEALAKFRKDGQNIKFTINLSGQVFNDTKLVSFIQKNLEKYDLEPAAVILEITEQVAVRHLEQARGLIQELTALGCRFALDDFGSGFSSFNYLKHLPVDYIKIDGSFIRNMANDSVDRTMVESILQIAKAVGKQTIAEYVQNAETLTMLSELGVDYAQGFHIGKPAETLLETSKDSN